MSGTRQGWRSLLVLAMTLCGVAGAEATTLRRMGLEELSRTNDGIVIGRVVDVLSYWNADGTFILSDVRVAPTQVLKGDLPQQELSLTVLGGTVGELSTIIVGGSELVIGREYLLFVSPSDLPGATDVLSVRDHCQGTFDVLRGKAGALAISQARHHPLLSDDRGVAEPPGGQEGLPLDFVIREIGRVAGPRK